MYVSVSVWERGGGGVALRLAHELNKTDIDYASCLPYGGTKSVILTYENVFYYLGWNVLYYEWMQLQYIVFVVHFTFVSTFIIVSSRSWDWRPNPPRLSVLYLFSAGSNESVRLWGSIIISPADSSFRSASPAPYISTHYDSLQDLVSLAPLLP